MGTLGLDRNGFLVANACSIPPKPAFGVTLVLRSRSRIGGFGTRGPCSGVGIVVASRGAGGRSSAESILEKDIKFSPSFEDYVKVLESVHTDRRRHLRSDSENSRSGHRSTENDGSRKLSLRGGREFAKSRVNFQGRSISASLESKLNGGPYTKYGWTNEQEGEISGDENGRNRWGQEARNGSMTCEHSDDRGSVRNSRSVRLCNHNNIQGSACNVKVGRRQVNCFGALSEKELDQTQNEKEERGECLNGRKNGRRLLAERYQGHLRHNYPQLRAQFDNMEDKFSTIPEYGNNTEQFGTAGPSWKRFRGVMSELKTTKKHPEKVRTLNGNQDFVYAETELESSCVSRVKYETDIVDELQLHQLPLPRHHLSRRTGKGKIRSHAENVQHNVLDMDSEGEQQNQSTHNMDIGARNHSGHSLKSGAFCNSRELTKEYRKENAFISQQNVLVTDKVGLRISRTDKTQSSMDVQYDRDGRHVGHSHLDDRAAFKTFEVFTDIKNRPRVLRMELEERIQHLAKWLNSTDVNMPKSHFFKSIHNSKIKFTDHSILRIIQMLGTFGNWRRVLQVVEWLRSRERYNSYKSRYIYTTVLSVLGKAKRPVEALNVFYAMRQELSSYPDLAAYHCIAVILGQAGLMKELFDVIDCMRAIPEKKFKLGMLQTWDPRLEPDLVVYNAVLNACVQQKQWEGAFWVLQELRQKGIQPSNVTYGLVMEVMLVCGKYNLVHEFFRKVQKNSIPGALNYKVLVNTLWREGKIDEAVLAVKEMEGRGVVGSASLYYDVARCLCSVGRCEEALLQIDKLCKVAQKPLVVTYTGLIQCCLESGSFQNAKYIFKQMQKVCSPNVVTYNIMLKSYVEHGLFQEAKQLFQSIVEGNKCINKKSDLRGKIVPDKFTFNTMMEACIHGKHWDDFEYAYEQMLCYGYHFDVKRHLCMIMEALRAGKVQSLEMTFEHLIGSGRSPPPAIVKERFCLRLLDGGLVSALACLDIDETSKPHGYSENSWFNTLSANLGRLDRTLLVRLVSEIDNRPPPRFQNSTVIRNLSNACKKIIASGAASTHGSDCEQSLLLDLQ